jgi:lauroyl/myristoyl acyltransferase
MLCPSAARADRGRLPAAIRHGLFRLVERIADAAIRLAAAVLVRLVPADRVHATTYRLIAATYPVLSCPFRLLAPPQRQRDWRPMMLRQALAVMTRIRPGFPIAVRMEGGAALDDAWRESRRVILCTAHFGLTLAAPRALIDRGYRIAGIADPAGGKDDGWNWGLAERLRILADRPDVFLHARAALDQGIVIVCYADHVLAHHADGSRRMALSPNAVRFARRVGAAVLFLGARLDPDGAITIEIHRPEQWRPRTARDADACVGEFVAFARARTGFAYEVRAPRKT